MFGFTYPSGRHYTTQCTQCHGNIGNKVPGLQPAHRGWRSKKTTDVKMSKVVTSGTLKRVRGSESTRSCKRCRKVLQRLRMLATAETFSSMALVSRLPAGCSWEGATLWLISGQWFSPKRARSAHQWAHFPSSSHSHARPLPSYESACGEREHERESERQEVILLASGPSPISPLANS